MHIKDIKFIFVEDKYEIEYHVSINHNLRFDEKLYDIYIARYNKDWRKVEHSVEFGTLIGNPVYLFEIFNKFRDKPNTYFWNLNKLFSKKEIDFPNPNALIVNVISYDGFATPIRFY